MMRKIIPLTFLLASCWLMLAQKVAAPVASLRIYLFDCGVIQGEDPLSYGLRKGQVKDAEMVVPCYLIVHPKGTLVWDVGAIPDSAFHGDHPMHLKDGNDLVTVSRPLLPQMAALGYPASSITYVAFSHYHFDHIANANAFAGSTWLVHGAERDAMFHAGPQEQALYSQLRDSKTIVLTARDYDVFGDGSVVIKYAPGHTPGHQVLALRLPKTGPVLIAGDLWHYVAERTLTAGPSNDESPQQTMTSRRAMEAYLKQSGAQLWIEHDPATFARLKKAPDFIE